MRWAGLLILLTSPAFPESALISIAVEEETVVFTNQDIQLAEPTTDQIGGSALNVRLHPSLDARFAEFTQRNVGKVLTVRICGEIVVEPVLRSPLYRAEFIVSTGSSEDANRLANLLKAEACPDLSSS